MAKSTEKEKQIAKQKANPKKYAKIQRERYREDKEYRDYKIEYAKRYQKRKARRTSK